MKSPRQHERQQTPTSAVSVAHDQSKNDRATGVTGDPASPTRSLFKHVAVPINGRTPNERSVPIARDLAQHLGCDIEFASMLFDSKHLAERARLVHLLALRLKGIPVLTNIAEGGDPSAFILDLVNRPDTLVVLAGGTSIIGLPGSVTTDVVRFAARPFVVVGPRANPTWQGPITSVIVPLDGSKAAESSLRVAVEWAQFFDATVELIQVIDPQDSTNHQVDFLTSYAGDAAAPDAPDVAYLEHVAESLMADQHCRVTFEVLHARRPHRVGAIAEYADRGCGRILTMASNGFRRSGAMVAGTTLRVIHHAEIPALIVRT